MKPTILLLAVMMAVTLTLSGCFGQSLSEKAGEKMVEKAIESQTGGQVDINTEGGDVTIKSEDGQSQFSAGGNAKVPEGFPQELMIADDAKVIMSTSADGGMSVAYVTDSEQNKLSEDYASRLTGDGWKKVMELDTGNGKMLSFTKDKKTVSVTIRENTDKDQPGKTTAHVVYVEEKDQ
jgi:hypothetical protein